MTLRDRCAVLLRVPMVIAVFLSTGQTVTVRAHGTEARRVVVLAWKRDHITRVLGANRSELGLNGSKAPEQTIAAGADREICFLNAQPGKTRPFEPDGHVTQKRSRFGRDFA